jgi:hypothetical protein
MIGKRHIGLAGYPLKPSAEELVAALEDHQGERRPDGAALTSMAHPGSVPPDLDPDQIERAWVEVEDPPWRAEMTQMAKSIGKELDTLRALSQASDPQFARSLLDFNERLTRIEKQIAFMSSAQALQERQLALHKRATGLDLAIKACGPGQHADDFTSTAEAFVIWLEPGVSG